MIRARLLIPEALTAVVRKAPLCDEKVDFAWNAAVGPLMSRATSVQLDGEGVLRVTTSDPHWGREVNRSARLILARLEPMLGQDVVRRIKTVERTRS